MNLKQETFLFSTLIAMLTGMALRITQLIFAIDENTGFAVTDSLSAKALTGVVIIFAVMVILAFVLIKKRDIFIVFHDSPHAGLFSKIGIFSFVIGLLVYSIMSIYLFVSSTGAAAGGNDIATELLNKITDVIPVVEVFFVALLFMYLFKVIKAMMNKTELNISLIMLAPVCFSIIRVVDVFIKYTGIANISSRTFEMVMLISFVLFFTAQLKARTKRGSVKFMFIMGTIAVFFSSLAGIPQLITMTNFDNMTSLPQFIATTILDISILIFILSSICPVWQSAQPDEAEDKEDDDLQEVDVEEEIE